MSKDACNDFTKDTKLKKEEKLKVFESESAAAYQIALDRPSAWELLLTVELLRLKLKVILRDYNQLKRGLVSRPSKYLEKQDIVNWLRLKFKNLSNLINLIGTTVNEEFNKAGEPPGDA